MTPTMTPSDRLPDTNPIIAVMTVMIHRRSNDCGLNKLSQSPVLYTTSKGTDYLFKGTSKNSGIIYCINNNKKYLSKIVIEKAIEDYTNVIEIDMICYKKTFS